MMGGVAEGVFLAVRGGDKERNLGSEVR